jgi:6-phosphogluconolactonase (cycloisomerase 2 family)
LTGCPSDDGSDSTPDQTAQLTQLSPFQANAAEAGFTLQLRGKSFTSITTALWNGVPKDTTFISSEHLEASIAAADIVSQDVVKVSVRYDEDSQSNYLPFFVQTSVPRFLYVTQDLSGNIFAFSIDDSSGSLTEVLGSPFAFTSGRIKLVAGANGRHLYLLDETTKSVFQVSIDRTTGALNKPDIEPISGVDWIMIDPAGDFLFTSLGVYAIDKTTGNLSSSPSSLDGLGIDNREASDRFWDASARFVYYPEGNRYDGPAYTIHRYWFNRKTIELEYLGSNIVRGGSTSLGGIADPTGSRIVGITQDSLDVGSLMSFNIDPLTGEPNRSEGEIELWRPSSAYMGSGPIDFHPSGRFAYIMNNDLDTSIIDTINIDLASGAISNGSSYYAEDFLGLNWFWTGPVIVSPTGRHLYISAFSRDTSGTSCCYIVSIPIDALTGFLISSAESFQLGGSPSQTIIVQ